MSTTTMPVATGTCPDCARTDLRLKTDGTIFRHSGLDQKVCPGVGKLPATDDTPAPAPPVESPVRKKGESVAKWRARLEAGGHRLTGAKSNPTHDITRCDACKALDEPAVHPATHEIIEPSLAQAALAAELPPGAWAGAEALELSPLDIDFDPDNARGDDLGDLSELAASLIVDGMLQPVVVVPVPDASPQRFRLVAGHRRVAAARLANLATVPALMRPDLVEARRLAAAQAVENLQRRNLDPIQEAKAFRRLADAGAKQEEIANRVGVNQGHVSKRLSLLKLAPDAQAAVAAGTIKVEDAVELSRLPKEAQTMALPALLEGGYRAAGAIARARNDYEEQRERQAIIDRLAADGITVVEWPGWYWRYDDGVPLAIKGHNHPHGVTSVAVLDETPAKHKRCPGHVATITPKRDVMYLCTDPARHGIAEPADEDDDGDEAWRAEQAARRAEEDAALNARRVAALTAAKAKVRPQQMGELLATGTLLAMSDELQFLPGSDYDDTIDALVALADDDEAAQLLLGDDLRDDWDRLETLASAAVDKHGALRFAFAATVMSTCNALRPASYWRNRIAGHEHFRLFYELLAATGYELTDADQAWLTAPEPWTPVPMPDERPEDIDGEPVAGWFGGTHGNEDEARWVGEAELEAISQLLAGTEAEAAGALVAFAGEKNDGGERPVGEDGEPGRCPGSGREFHNVPSNSQVACRECGLVVATDERGRYADHRPLGAELAEEAPAVV